MYNETIHIQVIYVQCHCTYVYYLKNHYTFMWIEIRQNVTMALYKSVGSIDEAR